MFFTTRKALISAVIAAALIAAFTGPSVADSKNDLEQQKRSAGNKVDDAKKALDGSTKKYADAVSSLKSAQGRLDTAKATLGKTRGALAVAKARDAQMQAKLAASQADLDEAVAKLDKGQAELASSEASVEQFTVDNLQQGDRGMRAFGNLLRGEDPTTFSEQMSLNDSVSDSQIATMQRLDATRIILKLKREKVHELRDQVKAQREQAAANLVTKKQLESSAADQASSVGDLVGKRAKARSSAASAKDEDEKHYRAEVAERNRLSNQLAALAAKALGSKGGGGGKGNDTSGGDGGGTLSRPVSGPITSQYGMRVHPVTGVYKLHDGTDFGVACGTPVRAAASGTIIQQYYNGAYGNRVILNNGVMRGKSVVTTYNHLSRFALRAGARVKRGQVIAYSGTTGYSTGCHLHLMVLTNGATVNPMGWL